MDILFSVLSFRRHVKKCTLFECQSILHESTIWVHYFSSPTGDGTAILRGHPSHEKVCPLAVQRNYLHFSAILRPWVLVGPRESISRPPALQSSAILTELIRRGKSLAFYGTNLQNRRLWKQLPGWRFLKTPASRLLVDGRKQGFLIRWCHTSYTSREYTTSITHTLQRMLSYFHRFIVLMWTSENDLNTLHVDAYLPLGNYLRQCTFVYIRQMCFLERVRQYD